MGNASLPEDVMLFVSVIYHEKAPVHEAVYSLTQRFGEISVSIYPIPFTFTSYYYE